jgi:hypothetical protein
MNSDVKTTEYIYRTLPNITSEWQSSPLITKGGPDHDFSKDIIKFRSRMTLLSFHQTHVMLHHDDYYNVRIAHIVFIHFNVERKWIYAREKKLISQVISHKWLLCWKDLRILFCTKRNGHCLIWRNKIDIRFWISFFIIFKKTWYWLSTHDLGEFGIQKQSKNSFSHYFS